MSNSNTTRRGTKRLFLRLGTCSKLLFHILDREFGNPMETEERAWDQLCGGLALTGRQCGMLWKGANRHGNELSIDLLFISSQEYQENRRHHCKSP
jgi:hypothetical protein